MTTLDRMQHRLSRLRDFVDSHNLPEGFYCYLGSYSHEDADISVEYEASDEVLFALGEALGKDGWTAEPKINCFDWVKHYPDANITVRIERVKKIELQPYAVDPNSFPLLLCNQ
jgi:hypothetical protein